MLIAHQLSQGTFGRVLSLRDTDTNQVAPRPSGRTKTITHSEEVTVTITPSDPDAAAIYGPMPISLGLKTWAKEVPDVDPLWQAWLDADRISDELLADVPEPDEVVLDRLKQSRRAQLTSWWKSKESTGITPSGHSFALGMTASDVSLLTGAFTLAQTAVAIGAAQAEGPFSLIDIAGSPHSFTLAELIGVMLSYGSQRGALSGQYAAFATAIEAATNQGELPTIE